MQFVASFHNINYWSYLCSTLHLGLTAAFPLTHPLGVFTGSFEGKWRPPRLEDIVRDLEELALTTRHEDGWSIQEHAGHLLDIESLMSGRMDQLLAGSDELLAWTGNDATWAAAHNSNKLETILAAFRDKRRVLISKFEAVPDNLLDEAAFNTRLKKSMRVVDLVAFIAEHYDHHLTKIAQSSSPVSVSAAHLQDHKWWIS